MSLDISKADRQAMYDNASIHLQNMYVILSVEDAYYHARLLLSVFDIEHKDLIETRCE